jgi:hypothetical protein
MLLSDHFRDSMRGPGDQSMHRRRPTPSIFVHRCSMDGGVARCMYIAAGPIDTPMLHRNHWVSKARGSELFYNGVLASSRETYSSIFVDCSHEALETAARAESTVERKSLQRTMAQYEEARRRAFLGDMGVISPETCASALTEIIQTINSESGVYLITCPHQPGTPSIKFAPFSAMDRRKSFG